MDCIGEFRAVLPVLLVVALLLLVFEWTLARGWTIASHRVEGAPDARVANLDGLRAFLAFGVVCSHLASYREHYFPQHSWGWPESFYLRHAGEAAVQVFFMITGFLFWRKAIASGGRLNPVRLYVNRFRRIYPLYLALWAVTLAIVLVVGGWQLRVSETKLLREISGFLLPGWWPWGTINGVERGYVATQTWSLKYEIYYYLALPALAVFARSLGHFAVFLVVAIACLATGWWPFGTLAGPTTVTFLVGMAAAHVSASGFNSSLARRRTVALLLVGAIAAVPLLRLGAPSRLGMIVYSCAFLAVVLGNDLFGMLRLRSAVILGDASYSVYLLHAPILFVYLNGVNHLWPIARMPALTYWLTVGLGGLLIVGFASCATYRWIEQPFLHRRASTPRIAPS